MERVRQESMGIVHAVDLSAYYATIRHAAGIGGTQTQGIQCKGICTHVSDQTYYLQTQVPSLKVSLNAPIFHAVNPQLKDQIRRLDLHVQFEIQVVKFDAFRRRQSCEQMLGDRVDVRRQRADFDQLLIESIRSFVALACNQLIFNNQ